MLDGLLGRGFASKCKTLIKLTKTRIDVIRRKRNATQKFLKKDIADLLTNGLDINAYGRADGLTAEVILSSCYDFVERCCDLVLKNLSVMQKQSECPEECKDPVSSLMVAAARFSDLPELRDLRQLFQERYANALELFVNQKFVENIASKPPTLEKKVQLMKDIAVEFSINWDSKAFVQRMSKPTPAITQDKPKTYGPSHVSDDKAKLSTGKSAVPKGDKHNLFPTEKRLDNYGGQHSDAKLAIKEEETPKLKPPYNYGVPPPYVKPNAKPKDRKHEAKDGSGSKRITKDPVAYNIAFVDKILRGVNVGSDDEDEMPAAAKVNKHDHEKDRAHRDDASSIHIPKPRSSRTRRSRSRSSHNDAGNREDTEVAIRKTRSRRKDESRRGLQLLFDDEHHEKDEEERRMDELLIHYSKKPSNVEPEMSRRKSRSRHAHHAGTGVKESPRQASRDESETVPTAVRSVSLPNEHSGPSEVPKVFARAASFQPDRSNPAKHVHPKLPDYEDLAAQFAALRGR